MSIKVFESPSDSSSDGNVCRNCGTTRHVALRKINAGDLRLFHGYLCDDCIELLRESVDKEVLRDWRRWISENGSPIHDYDKQTWKYLPEKPRV